MYKCTVQKIKLNLRKVKVDRQSAFQACDDEYQYHYKLFGEGAGADRDMKFYAPQMVKDYINQIRRF